MSRGMPSMVALLGLLAVAGYQNREKIGELLGGAGRTNGGLDRDNPQPGLGRVLGNLGGLLGGASPANVLTGGLGELVKRFKQNGQGETAESWIRTGPNQPITADQLERTIGPETLQTLVEQTGLSRQEVLARLARTLPDAVDRYTPEGKLP